MEFLQLQVNSLLKLLQILKVKVNLLMYMLKYMRKTWLPLLRRSYLMKTQQTRALKQFAMVKQINLITALKKEQKGRKITMDIFGISLKA